MPALLGKVGNILALFGLGSSLKYSCANTSSALGRRFGSRDSREVSSDTPAEVKKGNRVRILGVVEAGDGDVGRRRVRALGRRRKLGKVASVGRPVRSKIWAPKSVKRTDDI